MLAAMACFTLEDVFIKQLSATLSTGQILITSGIISSIFFAWMAIRKKHSLFAGKVWTTSTIARMFAESFAAVAFVKALSLMPLSTVAAVFQATPLAITMGAALFLGEKVGWRRWLAIAIGFIGVMLIIKPGVTSLFLSRRGDAMSARTISHRLKNRARQQGINQNVHPHVLRHSFASHLLQSSGDLRAVQELLGHAHITSTQVYTHLDFQHLTQVYDSAHPRAKKKG